MKRFSFYALLLLCIWGCKSDDEAIDPPMETPDFEGYILEWSDEFNGNSINTLNWVHELGDGTAYGIPAGWGNNELQLYTDAAENSYIEEDADGVSALVISSFYLILNVAVGGNWPGNPDATTTFPQKMYIDYIRYYSKDDFTAPDAPAVSIEEETVGVYVPPSIAQYAFNSALNQFLDLELKVFGGGGEPEILSSDVTVEGDSALLFSFPGGSWGAVGLI